MVCVQKKEGGDVLASVTEHVKGREFERSGRGMCVRGRERGKERGGEDTTRADQHEASGGAMRRKCRRRRETAKGRRLRGPKGENRLVVLSEVVVRVPVDAECAGASAQREEQLGRISINDLTLNRPRAPSTPCRAMCRSPS